jgi:hypothetical protein
MLAPACKQAQLTTEHRAPPTQRKIVLMDPTEPREDVWQRIATFPDVYVLLVRFTRLSLLLSATDTHTRVHSCRAT